MVRAIGWELDGEEEHDIANYLIDSLVKFIKSG